MAKKAPSKSTEEKPQDNTPSVNSSEKPQNIECGLVMPISEIDGCNADHWEQVREIIEEALATSKIRTRLVSDADEVGIIQERIVKNLYQNPIVVCDVSCKNPNVMFELGLRLAFDKPTVVIKDDETAYSFDTSPIEHIPYPRDLNYRSMVKFKKTLRQKVESTLEISDKDPNYSTFLGAFRIKNVVAIPTDDMGPSEFMLSELKDLKKMISGIGNKNAPMVSAKFPENFNRELSLSSLIKEVIEKLHDENIIELKNNDETRMKIYNHIKENYERSFTRYPVSSLMSKISQLLIDLDKSFET